MIDIVYSILVIMAAYIDSKTQRIPNWISAIIFILGVIIIYKNGIVESGVGFLLGGIPFLFVALKGKVGGGDVKYMAANGLYLGKDIIMSTLIATMTICIVALVKKIKPGTRVALAPYLSLGCLCVIILRRLV